MTAYPDIGKFVRLSLLGEGSFGKVFRVLDRALETERALKVIPATAPQDLIDKLREARILETCKHKHIVEVKEADIAQVDGADCAIIVCELMAGGSVQDALCAEWLSLRRSCSYVMQGLFGLEYLHNNGIIHCDIKPGNMLLDGSHVVKLSDFGLAMHMQPKAGPAYIYTLHCAPELITGHGADCRSDVYAMGVTFFRLLNKVVDLKVLAPADMDELKTQISSGRFPNRNQYGRYVPRKMRLICNRAMHVDPARRFQSAGDFRKALDKLTWGIEWQRTGPSEWRGAEAGKALSHLLRAYAYTGGWTVEHSRNGRRQLANCRTDVASESEALAHMDSLVARSSLC